MATKKSKTSNKSTKTKSTKSKTSTKTVEKTELEAPNIKEEKEVKEVKEVKEASKKDAKVQDAPVKEKASETITKVSSKQKKSFLSGFFARKYEEKEGILTVFKSHKFYGALLGEVIGTMLLAMLLFALIPLNQAAAFNVTTHMFPVIAILIAIYAFSGALLNPIITVGMMATRRISVIRGIMYIIAEIVGAWLAWLIFNAFHLAGGETAMDMSKLSEVSESSIALCALIELVGAIIIAFFFSRALKYKRSVFTFAAVVAGGISVAMIVGYVISAGFLGLSSNFIFNPAIASMLEIFPTSGDDFGQVIGGIMQALSIYAVIPMLGGVVGFYLSDFTSKLSGEE